MPFEWSSEIHQATWWVNRLHPFGQDVGSVPPDGFAACARVFHPINDQGRLRRWAEVASETGRLAHAEMQLHEITRPLGAPRPRGHEMDYRARRGSLPGPELAVLGGLLGSQTTTPDRCWCCVWEGYGQLHGSPAVARNTRDGRSVPVAPLVPDDVRYGARVSTPGRAYYLSCGPVAELRALAEQLGGQSPNVWWPHDRAWFVATEVDFAWTYVGASTRAIGEVLAEPRLEALPAQSSDRFDYDSDTRNAALDGDDLA